MSSQSPQTPPPDPYGRRRPIDYQTPQKGDNPRARTVLRVLFLVFVGLIVAGAVLLGTCVLLMNSR
jgi:hypothetical protein